MTAASAQIKDCCHVVLFLVCRFVKLLIETPNARQPPPRVRTSEPGGILLVLVFSHLIASLNSTALSEVRAHINSEHTCVSRLYVQQSRQKGTMHVEPTP